MPLQLLARHDVPVPRAAGWDGGDATRMTAAQFVHFVSSKRISSNFPQAAHARAMERAAASTQADAGGGGAPGSG